MLKIISHRGNLSGRSCDENKPSYIKTALTNGFDVEVDVWLIADKLFLGHDEPQYETNIQFLTDTRIWCHAKNIEAFSFLIENNIHCFWHETDKFTITSKGIPWGYPKNYIQDGITVELGPKIQIPNILGVCTDYPLDWSN
jgi:hypothetical protein